MKIEIDSSVLEGLLSRLRDFQAQKNEELESVTDRRNKIEVKEDDLIVEIEMIEKDIEKLTGIIPEGIFKKA